MSLLDVRNLTVEFVRGHHSFAVVTDVSFHLEAGEALGLVGESGAGKSILTQAITRLIPTPPARYTSGRILLNNRDVLEMSEAEVRSVRGKRIAYVFQEPRAALNPAVRIGRQIEDVLRFHHPQKATGREVLRLLNLVGFPDAAARLNDFPPQLSGGMLQRVALALALACEPELLVADEPTGSLDVTRQAEILDLFRRARNQMKFALIFITHNLALVQDVAERIAVMYAGQLVEVGGSANVLETPLHPYTENLLRAVKGRSCEEDRFATVPGCQPTPGAMLQGCRFHPRCFKVQSSCIVNSPTLLEVENGRWVRCPFWDLPNPSNATKKKGGRDGSAS